MWWVRQCYAWSILVLLSQGAELRLIKWTNRMDSAAACSLGSTASSWESHQWWDHSFPGDHQEAWTCEAAQRKSDLLGKKNRSQSRHTEPEEALLVIGKRVHQEPLLNELFPLGVLRLQVSVVVVGHDDSVWLHRQLDDVSVIVTHHPLAVHTAGRRVHQDLPPLQFMEDMLICRTQDDAVEYNTNL